MCQGRALHRRPTRRLFLSEILQDAEALHPTGERHGPPVFVLVQTGEDSKSVFRSLDLMFTILRSQFLFRRWAARD